MCSSPPPPKKRKSETEISCSHKALKHLVDAPVKPLRIIHILKLIKNTHLRSLIAQEEILNELSINKKDKEYLTDVIFG